MGEKKEAVVLVHGLWMHGLVFLPHLRWLTGKGFAVHRFSYPSVGNGLRQNAEALCRVIAAANSDRIHLVGHSLGGLVVLDMLARRHDPRLRRAVLMGSPCMGSHAASAVAGLPWISAIIGRSLKDWLSLRRPDLPEEIEIGVLAGNFSLGIGRLVPGLPQPNDGVVAVAETRWPGARDSIVLPVSHAGMLVSRECSDQVAAFLRSGCFVHEPK